MANYCYYLIRAKGTKKAALMAYASTPKSGDDFIVAEFGTEDKYVVWYYGECKWDLDAYCKEKHSVEMDLTNLSEEDLRAGEGYDYWDLTMRQRSEVLGVDLFAHSWSEESDFDVCERWNNGSIITELGCGTLFEALKEKEHINFSDGLRTYHYLIRAKGTKKAALMAYASTPEAGALGSIVAEFGTEDEYVVWYQGDIDYTFDAYYSNEVNIEIDLTNLTEYDLRNGEVDFNYESLSAKQCSEVLGVDLFAHSWSSDYTVSDYEHWNEGAQINHGNWKYDGSSMIESDFAALKEKEHINFNDDIGNIWDVHISYTKDRIKAYNSKQKAGRFSASFYNPVIISILQKYKYKPFFNNINSQEVILSGKKIPQYAGVQTLDEFTSTLINIYISFGLADNGFEEELMAKQKDIANAFSYIEGVSYETTLDKNDLDKIASAYNLKLENNNRAYEEDFRFQLTNGKYKAMYEIR